MDTNQRELQDRVVRTLRDAATRLNQARLPDLSETFDQLAGQVVDPCVVAVVGRMKAGKSSFINALLREDLAKVGVTETTATINRFVYGKCDEDRPVRCYWRNGRVTSESQSFLDALQGNTAETLRQAMDIRYLEYAVENEYLRNAVLVDTPGMCTTVAEHKKRTAEFLQLAANLGTKHSEDTSRLGREADAVIYLVGEVARQTDDAFLSEFQTVTSGGSSALNAVGVLAKIDLSTTILRQRHELSTKIAHQLKGSLNTVIPVSSGIRRAIDRMDAGDLPPLAQYVAELARVPLPRLEKLLDNADFYLELEWDDCPLSVAEREALLADMPWAVFTTIARAAVDTGCAELARRDLDALSGFDRLTEVLDEHLFRRGRFLRAHNTVQKARALLEQVRHARLAEARRQDREMKSRLEKFLDFVRESRGDPGVAAELEAYLTEYGPRTNHEHRLEAAYGLIGRDLAELRIILEEYGNDFSALQALQKNEDPFSAAELDELRALFGMHGLEIKVRAGGEASLERAASRQQFWRSEARFAREAPRRLVSAEAERAYGLIMARIVEAVSSVDSLD